MKKSNISKLLCLVLFSTIAVSCSNDMDDIFPPRIYQIRIRVEDKLGNDKVKGIPFVEHTKTSDRYEVQRGQYTLEVSQSEKPEEVLFLAPVSVVKDDLYESLVIATSTKAGLPDYRPEQFTHRIVCPYIFGDSKARTIVSNWERPGTVHELCKSITIDGKTFNPIEMDEMGASIFLVVLDE